MEKKILNALFILNLIIIGCSLLFINGNDYIFWGFMILSWFITYQCNRLSKIYFKIKLDELKKELDKISADFIASLK